MTIPGHTTVTPTLDSERLGQLRSFLADEVTASPAPAPTHPGRINSHRLLVAGVAGVLVAGIATGVALGVGPGGPSAAEAAVAIEQQQGWTTIRLLDASADPGAVLAALEAAEIDARIQALERHADGKVGIRVTVDPERPEAAYVGMLDPDAAVGLTVTLPPEVAPLLAPTPPAGHPTDATVTGPFDPSAFEAGLEAAGIRLDDDSLSIRNDAGHEVVILTAD